MSSTGRQKTSRKVGLIPTGTLQEQTAQRKPPRNLVTKKTDIAIFPNSAQGPRKRRELTMLPVYWGLPAQTRQVETRLQTEQVVTRGPSRPWSSLLWSTSIGGTTSSRPVRTTRSLRCGTTEGREARNAGKSGPFQATLKGLVLNVCCLRDKTMLRLTRNLRKPPFERSCPGHRPHERSMLHIILLFMSFFHKRAGFSLLGRLFLQASFALHRLPAYTIGFTRTGIHVHTLKRKHLECKQS